MRKKKVITTNSRRYAQFTLACQTRKVDGRGFFMWAGQGHKPPIPIAQILDDHGNFELGVRRQNITFVPYVHDAINRVLDLPLRKRKQPRQKKCSRRDGMRRTPIGAVQHRHPEHLNT